jgi:farnesyl diphosphate synthase
MMNLQANLLNRNPEPAAIIQSWQESFDERLSRLLDVESESPGKLLESMRYSSLAGGKRIRPMLVYASGMALGIEQGRLHAIAVAIELIHTYSLIHDDLPAMDDDDLRRGRPTNHRVFDEATAILAGDALQALAFEVLAADRELGKDPAAQVRIIRDIARACGAEGMAGGQVLDLAAIDQEIGLEELETMHRMKTGALIRVSATAPAYLASGGTGLSERLDRYGACVGLAFQIHDDVLDVTGSSQQTGKPSHADAARNKPAFPSVIGLESSRDRANNLCERAIEALVGFPGDTTVLRWLADYTIHRAS